MIVEELQEEGKPIPDAPSENEMASNFTDNEAATDATSIRTGGK